jgi:hypothetical protein
MYMRGKGKKKQRNTGGKHLTPGNKHKSRKSTKYEN